MYASSSNRRAEVASVVSGIHGRERREQRKIDRDDLREARRHGMKESAAGGLFKFTYRGSVFVINPRENREVTSYISNDWASPFSGTRHTPPILISKKKEYMQREVIDAHKTLRKKLLKNSKKRIASHTLFLLNMSSSMRQDDVNGARCRSDAVWGCLALGYVQERLLAKKNKKHDVVSIIQMRDNTAKLQCKAEPLDHVLYNMLLDLREFCTSRPNGKPCYATALQQAQTCLELGGDCPVSICVISDAIMKADSLDADLVVNEEVANNCDAVLQSIKNSELASRLTSLTCVGLGNETDDFHYLTDIVQSGQKAGLTNVKFQLADLDLHALSHVLREVAREHKSPTSKSARPPPAPMILQRTTTSTTTTGSRQTSNPAADTDEDKEKEPPPPPQSGHDSISKEVAAAPDSAATADKICVVAAAWVWDNDKELFLRLVDRRCQSCYTNVGDATGSALAHSQSGFLCASCESAFYCQDCMNQFTWHLGSDACAKATIDNQAGRLTRRYIPSYSISLDMSLSAAQALFSGRSMQFVNVKREPIGGGSSTRCKELGCTEWSSAPQSVLDYCRSYCKSRLAGNKENETCRTAAAPTASRTSAVGATGKLLAVMETMILELEGNGCIIIDGGQCLHEPSWNEATTKLRRVAP